MVKEDKHEGMKVRRKWGWLAQRSYVLTDSRKGVTPPPSL